MTATCTHISTFEAYASDVDGAWALPLRGENQPKQQVEEDF